jgi:hypothetical protein
VRAAADDTLPASSPALLPASPAPRRLFKARALAPLLLRPRERRVSALEPFFDVKGESHATPQASGAHGSVTPASSLSASRPRGGLASRPLRGAFSSLRKADTRRAFSSSSSSSSSPSPSPPPPTQRRRGARDVPARHAGAVAASAPAKLGAAAASRAAALLRHATLDEDEYHQARSLARTREERVRLRARCAVCGRAGRARCALGVVI